MYTLRKSLLALSALVVCAAVAHPADKDESIVAREDAIEVVLLRQSAVQQDLRITEGERKKIDAFATKQWQKVKQMKDLSEAERTRRFEAMAKENQQFLKSTLKPEQQKRLNQIAMQVAGLLWVMRSDVASQLSLTEEQRRKIKDAHKEAEKDAKEALRSGGEVRDEKFNELRTNSRKKLMSILTDAQKTKWKEMAGQKFDGKLAFSPRSEK